MNLWNWFSNKSFEPHLKDLSLEYFVDAFFDISKWSFNLHIRIFKGLWSKKDLKVMEIHEVYQVYKVYDLKMMSIID